MEIDRTDVAAEVAAAFSHRLTEYAPSGTGPGRRVLRHGARY